MDPQPRTIEQRTVAMDYGQFVLVGGHSGHELDYMPLLDLAGADGGRGVAGDGRMLVVLSPHQNNFQMELTVEVWDAEPPDADEGWEQVAQSWLEVDEGRFVYESPTVPYQRFDIPAGRYGVEVAGRGFVGIGWPGSTTPGDVWRVRLWPQDSVTPTRVLRAYAAPPAEPDPAPAVDPSRFAAADPLGLSALDPAVRALLPPHAATLADVQAAMAQAYGWDDAQVARARAAHDELTSGPAEDAGTSGGPEGRPAD